MLQERLLHVQAAGCEDAHRNLPPAAGGPDDLAGAGDWIGAWTPVTSQIWFVPFFKTQFDLPRAM